MVLNISRNGLYEDPEFYDNILWNLSADLPTYDAIIETVDPTSILEIGVGTGRLLRSKSVRKSIFIGIDTEEKMVSQCKDRFDDLSNASFYLSMVNNFRPKIKIECCILGNSVLKHFSKEDMENVGENLKDIISPDGVIIVDHADFLYYEEITQEYQPFLGTVDWFWPKAFRHHLKKYQWKKTIGANLETLHIKRDEQERKIVVYPYSIDEIKKSFITSGFKCIWETNKYHIDGEQDFQQRFFSVFTKKENSAEYKWNRIDQLRKEAIKIYGMN